LVQSDVVGQEGQASQQIVYLVRRPADDKRDANYNHRLNDALLDFISLLNVMRCVVHCRCFRGLFNGINCNTSLYRDKDLTVADDEDDNRDKEFQDDVENGVGNP